jgi:hypothetical protein
MMLVEAAPLVSTMPGPAHATDKWSPPPPSL